MVLVAWFGATVGGTGGWLLGARFGRRLMTAPGPLLALRRHALRHGDHLYERWGALAVFFAPSWAAGINGMRTRRFLPANTISALVWALAWGLGAYALGPSIADLLGDIGLAGSLAIGALLVGSLVARRLHGRRDRARP